MPFIRTDLTCVDGGGQRMWNYKTEDSQAAAAAAGYMNDMFDHFRLGDVVHIVADVVETTTPGLAQPSVMTGNGQKYFVSRLNDGTTPRPVAQVELTAFA